MEACEITVGQVDGADRHGGIGGCVEVVFNDDLTPEIGEVMLSICITRLWENIQI